MLHLRDIAAFYIAFNFINNFLFFWNIDMKNIYLQRDRLLTQVKRSCSLKLFWNRRER